MSEIENQPAEFQSPPANEVEVDLSPSMGRVPQVDNGLHKVVVKELRKIDSQFTPGKKTDVIGFALVGREDDGTLNVTPGRTEKSKFPWATVLTALKVKFTPGARQTFKAGDLIGKTCTAIIANEPSTRDPSKTFPKIKALVAA